MSDPLRDDPRTPGEGERIVDRPAKIEELLLLGLDQYFSGQYEQAINVWTRVLFLDRGHARARAYIERARGALAERQREGDELLHTGMDAFQRGDAAAARELLTSAVDRGVAPEVGLALLQRLDRLVIGSSPQPAPAQPLPAEHAKRFAEPQSPVGRGNRRRGPVLVISAVVMLAGGLTFWEAIEPWTFIGRTPQASVVPQRVADSVPVPAPGELSLLYARRLYDRGHLDECLAALDEIQVGDALKPQADLLRAAVQRALLAGTPALEHVEPGPEPAAR
jgi:hypothetical protein